MASFISLVYESASRNTRLHYHYYAYFNKNVLSQVSCFIRYSFRLLRYHIQGITASTSTLVTAMYHEACAASSNVQVYMLNEVGSNDRGTLKINVMLKLDCPKLFENAHVIRNQVSHENNRFAD